MTGEEQRFGEVVNDFDSKIDSLLSEVRAEQERIGRLTEWHEIRYERLGDVAENLINSKLHLEIIRPK